MLGLAINKLKGRNYIISMIFIFLFFIYIYRTFDLKDYGTYQNMVQVNSYLVVSIHIFINIIMAALSSIMIVLSYANFKLTGKEGDGSVVSAISLLFGLLTYGCPSCVIALLSSLSISYTVTLLPLANLGYKLIALAILIIGFIWVIYSIKNAKCKVKIKS